MAAAAAAMESSPFDPPLFPEFSPVAWIPPAVFFYAALVLAIATAIHAYMELFFLFSEKAPRVRPRAVLLGARAER